MGALGGKQQNKIIFVVVAVVVVVVAVVLVFSHTRSAAPSSPPKPSGVEAGAPRRTAQHIPTLHLRIRGTQTMDHELRYRADTTERERERQRERLVVDAVHFTAGYQFGLWLFLSDLRDFLVSDLILVLGACT